jgi:hypothetical protein
MTSRRAESPMMTKRMPIVAFVVAGLERAAQLPALSLK